MNRLKAVHIHPCQLNSNVRERVWLILRMKIMSVFVGAIQHLNPREKDAQRIKKTDRKMVQELNYHQC